jgi:hypothetical protein
VLKKENEYRMGLWAFQGRRVGKESNWADSRREEVDKNQHGEGAGGGEEIEVKHEMEELRRR